MNRRDLLKISAAAPAVALVSLPAFGADWQPKVFTPAQNQTVIQLTELIIPATDTPGAKAAKVNQYIDLFLADGPERERERFLAGLTWLDSHAKDQHRKVFGKLSPEQQTAILTKLDNIAVETGTPFFRMAKAMTARIYYQTEIGRRELNKNGVPGSFACAHTN